tara:strand:- start:5411 stop:6547 length:1137 start_codon:yes stop_codon:yes gene_type:complete
MINFIENKNFNPERVSKRLFTSSDNIGVVADFHKTLGNKETPLFKLDRLANYLGIGKVFLKDESQRFGLNAFKSLGASYAMHKQIKKFPEIKVFCTATDGNHGRAVAWMARKLRREALIYMPVGTIPERIKEIEKEGAEVILTKYSYDITVKMASKRVKEGNMLQSDNSWSLIQDTAWDGYEEIPMDIMRGYGTQIHEITRQIEEENIDILFLQSGVGSWAASVIMYILEEWESSPIFIGVEPHSSNCLYESIKVGRRVSVQTDINTKMAGLDCGSLSTIAWEILDKAVFGTISISDKTSEKAMQVLASPIKDDPKVISGESGASALGALIELCISNKYRAFKKKINLNRTSKILLINTEGNTDPVNYDRVINIRTLL